MPVQQLELPFFAETDQAQNVLIAGAGGGFDVLSGLPLFFALRAAGKRVHLASLSFSSLRQASGHWLGPKLMEVTPDTVGPAEYFPERNLSRWFRDAGDNVPVYAFERSGVRPFLESYQILVDRLKLDTVILADGGTDSLMRGDEFDLGTPEEDISSILAVSELSIPRRLLACLGFGVDVFHGVCHAQFLKNVSALIRSGAFRGAFTLTDLMPAVRDYLAGVREVLGKTPPPYTSIVCTSVTAAILGCFGDHHTTDRTQGSRLFINPLMSMYWCFDVAGVSAEILYRETARTTETLEELTRVISDFREHCDHIRPWMDLPV